MQRFAALGRIAPRTRGTAKTTAKERTEDVTQIAHIKAAESTAKAALTGAVIGVNTGKAELVITGALILIGQHFIRFVEFFELFSRFGVVPVEVGVVFFGKFAVGFLDILIGCALGNAQYFVIISFVSHVS